MFIEINISNTHYVKFTVLENQWKVTKEVLEVVSTDIKTIIIPVLPMSKRK